MGLNRNIEQWSVARKLSTLCLAVAVILLAVGALSATLLWDASTSLTSFNDQYLPFFRLSAAFEREVLLARKDFIWQLTIQKPGSDASGWEHFRNARALTPRLHGQVASSAALSNMLGPTDEMIRDLDLYEASLTRILEAVKNHQNEGELYSALLQDWTMVDNRLSETAAALSKASASLAEDGSRRNSAELAANARTSAMVCFAAGILGPLLGWFLARDLVRRLRTAATGVSAASEQFTAASEEISVASGLLMEGAAAQSRLLRKAAASCDEIAQKSGERESTARSLVSAVSGAQQASCAGVDALGRMKNSFNQMADSHSAVSEIVNVVESLAAQTNLLAIKAAVEACRSAEAAKALSALAEEAGSLAQRSALSTKETAAAIERTAVAMNAGCGYAGLVAGRLALVAAESIRAENLAGELNSQSLQQTHGIEQLAKEISQIERSAEIVTSAAGQTLAAAAAVSGQSQGFTGIAHELHVLAGAAARKDSAPDLSATVHEDVIQVCLEA